MIGATTPNGVTLHPDHCPCALCREHRELTTSIQESERRGYYVGPAVRLNLEQLERDLVQVVAA